MGCRQDGWGARGRGAARRSAGWAGSAAPDGRVGWRQHHTIQFQTQHGVERFCQGFFAKFCEAVRALWEG
jgi:hypothetical protein